jgi:hypothetical protein
VHHSLAPQKRSPHPPRPAHDWIGVAPLLVTTEQESDEIVAIIEKSIPEAITQ